MARKRRAKKNVSILEKLVTLRAKQAELLGYAHASDFENEVRMSGDARTVAEFYDRLQPMLRGKAEKDYALLLEANMPMLGIPMRS